MGLIRADSPGEVGWRKSRIQMDKKKKHKEIAYLGATPFLEKCEHGIHNG